MKWFPQVIARGTVAAALGVSAALFAHEGDDDDDGDQPTQVAVAVVSLDKAAQRRAGLRTLPVASAAPTVRLPARVRSDPRGDWRVAATQDGVIQPTREGLPRPGQAVKAGEVLAWLRPALARPERRDLGVDLAAAEREVAIGRLQIERYKIQDVQHFDIKLPTPTIQILTDYRSAQARAGELGKALGDALPLLTPRDAVVLRSPAVAGRVIAAGEPLFELTSPAAQVMEAEFTDEDLDAPSIDHATDERGRSVALHFLDESWDASLRVHRALYAVDAGEEGLAVNQMLTLDAPRRHAPQARLPAAALLARGNERWVWVHADAERFELRHVQVVAAEGGDVLVQAGLAPGDRIVAAGIQVLNARIGPRS